MKSKILRMLKESPAYVSGEELSAQLGVTRAAVWKAIGKLREAGGRSPARWSANSSSAAGADAEEDGYRRPELVCG